MTRDDFLREAIDAARESSRMSGMLAGITVAQAALESAFGKSELSRRANNYFGIKAHGKHASVEMPTTEVIGGVVRKVSAKFAAYPSMAECFACRDRLIGTSERYSVAVANKNNPAKFVAEVGKHWATDPAYAEKVLKVYYDNGLNRLDERALADGGSVLDAAP